MNLGVKFDIEQLKAKTEREIKNLAYATAQAINDTLQDVQQDERAHLDKVVKVRRAGFVYRLIKITAFANAKQGRPYGELAVDNTKARVLLSVLEDGGEKDPAKGKNVAVPLTGTAARPDFDSSVPQDMTFTGLRFKRMAPTQLGASFIRAKGKGKKAGVRGKLPNGMFVWQGQQRTFLLPASAKAPLGGVFQRVGKGKDGIRLIYSFRKHPKLKKMLGFVDTARRSYQQHFAENFARRFKQGQK